MNREEVWFWYQKCEEFRKSDKSLKDFCIDNNLNYAKFIGMQYRIYYKSIKDPQEYNKLVTLGNRFLESGLHSSTKFAREYNIKASILSATLTHLRYLKIIEELKLNPPAEEDKPKMQFVQVKPSVTGTGRWPQTTLWSDTHIGLTPAPTEVIEPKNDLEIIIAKGVKVTISPNIDTMKVVKIIEFLKDL